MMEENFPPAEFVVALSYRIRALADVLMMIASDPDIDACAGADASMAQRSRSRVWTGTPSPGQVIAWHAIGRPVTPTSAGCAALLSEVGGGRTPGNCVEGRQDTE